jgi:hypothetical protein
VIGAGQLKVEMFHGKKKPNGGGMDDPCPCSQGPATQPRGGTDVLRFRLPLMAVVRLSPVSCRQTDEGGCPFGLVALVSKKLERQVDALDLAKLSFRFGSAAAHHQVCLDLIQALERSVVNLKDGAAKAGFSELWGRSLTSL